MMLSSYPKDNPKAKHDIRCPIAIINALHNQQTSDAIHTIDSLISALLQSSLQQDTTLPQRPRLATVYTFKDAPSLPKPLSGNPRLETLVSVDLFHKLVTTPNAAPLQRCTVAVKLPSNIQEHAQDLSKRHFDSKNSQTFRQFMKQLHSHRQVALMGYDSAGRIGFMVPFSTLHEEDGYCASFYYAPMKELIQWMRDNCADSLGTWTPQYTPPREEDCGPCDEWDHVAVQSSMDTVPECGTWTPQYTPPPEEECGPQGWGDETNRDDEVELFVPSSSNDGFGGFGNDEWEQENHNNGVKPPEDNVDLFVPLSTCDSGCGAFGQDTWDTNGGWDDTHETTHDTGVSAWAPVKDSKMTEGIFHANEGAAAADAFYSGLTRSLDTRADSRLYHMRAFNGWVKGTQIAELDPDTSGKRSSSKQRSRRSPLRVLDLACGKGGDLGKWAIHPRKMENYVGVDVARGSLVDAAIRARQMATRGNPLKRCTFTLADLGEDVPGRKRSKNAMRMQKLLTWNLELESAEEKRHDPKFVPREGGGIAEGDKFDVVSIQFAIHYMMSTMKRARRFFHTVSSLLEIGGNLIATTIDARVVLEKLMGLGMDFHFDDFDTHTDIDLPENEVIHRNGNKRRKLVDGEGATVTVGQGVCRLKFDTDTLRKVFCPSNGSEAMFGLQYTFTLVEGSDHAAGVGEAVDLPEWLTPIPALQELGNEAGLELEYATNFHEFYERRKDPAQFSAAHNALYNMKVLNKDGSISDQEWEVSRMYVAIKFRKIRESMIELDDDDIGLDEMNDAG